LILKQAAADVNLIASLKLNTNKVEGDLEAVKIVFPPLSYPHMWQLFYDLNLKVEEPQNCLRVTWPAKASFVEIHVRIPDDVQLSCGEWFISSI